MRDGRTAKDLVTKLVEALPEHLRDCFTEWSRCIETAESGATVAEVNDKIVMHAALAWEQNETDARIESLQPFGEAWFNEQQED